MSHTVAGLASTVANATDQTPAIALLDISEPFVRTQFVIPTAYMASALESMPATVLTVATPEQDVRPQSARRAASMEETAPLQMFALAPTTTQDINVKLPSAAPSV
jgi:hypothetical protein